MADIYLSSVDGSDSDDGSTWALAKATLAAALTAAGAGGRVFVDHAHAESQTSAMTLTSPGTVNAPVAVLCVDRTGNPEPPTALATTATVATTTNNLTHITFSGYAYVYGVSFLCGDGGNNCRLLFTSTSRWRWSFESCLLKLNTTNASSLIQVGATGNIVGSLLELINTTVQFGAAGQHIEAYVQMLWQGGGHAGTAPTVLFSNSANAPNADVICHDLDLSAISGALVSVAAAGYRKYRFLHCSLHDDVTIETGTHAGPGGVEVDVERCEGGTITVPPLGLTYRGRYEGSITATLSRYRTGGANDGLQANEYSWAMTTNANGLELYNYLESPPITRFVEPDASISGATAQDIFTLYRGALLGTPAAWDTDATSTWNGSDVGTKQKIEHTLTNGQTLTVYFASAGTLNNDDFWIEVSEPDQVGGPVSVRCFLAKPSTTVYVDPRLEVA